MLSSFVVTDCTLQKRPDTCSIATNLLIMNSMQVFQDENTHGMRTRNGAKRVDGVNQAQKRTALGQVTNLRQQPARAAKVRMPNWYSDCIQVSCMKIQIDLRYPMAAVDLWLMPKHIFLIIYLDWKWTSEGKAYYNFFHHVSYKALSLLLEAWLSLDFLWPTPWLYYCQLLSYCHVRCLLGMTMFACFNRVPQLSKYLRMLRISDLPSRLSVRRESELLRHHDVLIRLPSI